MKFTGVIIPVNDMEKSLKFYKEILEQELEFDFGACQQFKSGLALQQEETMSKFLSYDQSKIMANSESINSALYFEAENFDALVERVQANDIELIHDVIEAEWGQRDIAFYDPDNHAIDIGEPMDAVCKRLRAKGMSDEDIATHTELPIKTVIEYLTRS